MDIHIGLEESVRKQLSQKLSLILADTYILYTKTQNFHWNIVDNRFYSLHLFLEKQYEELADAIDEIAERIRILGEKTPGSLKQFLDMTSIKESSNSSHGSQMIKELLDGHETMIRYLREIIDIASKLGDEGTVDLLVQRLRAHEKHAWMLRSTQ